jgi:hypothetical protein
MSYHMHVFNLIAASPITSPLNIHSRSLSNFKNRHFFYKAAPIIHYKSRKRKSRQCHTPVQSRGLSAAVMERIQGSTGIIYASEHDDER